MPDIRTVTLSYNADEDRIHLAMLLDDGRSVRLWLTQRLARTLVAALANHLEKVEGVPLPAVRHAMMAQEQAEAVSAIRPAEPVIVDTVEPGHLIREINVGLSPDHIALAFASDLDFKPGISVDRTMVRQWLSMLHRQFAQAGWPEDVWPGWMLEGGSPVPQGMTRH